MSQHTTFSSAVMILKDWKKKNHWDIIKVIERIDEKPITFDFGSGLVMVYRYVIETIDARLLLFVPAVKSFVKKIQINKFFELGAKRTYNYEVGRSKSLNQEGRNNTSEWILYVNRIKNLNQINLKLKDRIFWKESPKRKEIDLNIDENWLDKCLPIDNHLDKCGKYFESLSDIDQDTLLSLPFLILRLQYQRQIEIEEPTGSVIRNLEFSALSHNKKIVKLYVPFFLKDMVQNLVEQLLNNNLIVNKLKVFYKVSVKDQKTETFAGFLWDPTLSGFITVPKNMEQKLLSLKDGEDIFHDLQNFKTLEKLLKSFTDTENKLNEIKKQEKFLRNLNIDKMRKQRKFHHYQDAAYYRKKN